MSQEESRESKLQNLLKDERDRSSEYKRIYETLKEEHLSLRDELTLIHQKLREANDQNENIKSATKAKVQQLESTVKEKLKEIATLNEQLKSCDEKRIQVQAFEEATLHYEAKIKELHSEGDKVREQYNNLHYENAILKCKFESREGDFSRTIERINLQHQGEMELLHTKVEAIEKEKSSPEDSYALELKSSKREVLQLNSRIKTLLSECEELRAQNENLTLEMNVITRTNVTLTSDHSINIRLLESEKVQATMRVGVLEKELINAQEHRKFLKSELQASRLEVSSLKSQCEEEERKFRQVKTNLILEIEQWRATKESQLQQYVEEKTRLKSELQSLNSKMSQDRQSLQSKEQDLLQKVSFERQHFLKQTRELNQEKDKLQNIIKELQNETMENKQKTKELKQKFHTLISQKVELEKELLAAKGKTKYAKESGDWPQNAVFLQNSNLDYDEAIQELKNRIDMLSAGNSRAIQFQSSSAQSNEVTENEIIRLKLNWEQQKLQYLQRLEELESQLKEFKTTHIAEKREQEFKVKQYLKKINGLQEKNEQQKVSTDKSKQEKEELEKNHLLLRKQLSELQRKMEEYRLVVTLDPNAPTQSTPGLKIPEKTLTDIQNIPFETLITQTTSHQTECSQPVLNKQTSLKKQQQRRKSLKERDRQHPSKAVQQVISSSSDLENL